MDEKVLEQLENVPYQKDEDETALETIKHLLEEKDEFEPWLHDKKALDKFDPYFWNRYKKYLFHKVRFDTSNCAKDDKVSDVFG